MSTKSGQGRDGFLDRGHRRAEKGGSARLFRENRALGPPWFGALSRRMASETSIQAELTGVCIVIERSVIAEYLQPGCRWSPSICLDKQGSMGRAASESAESRLVESL